MLTLFISAFLLGVVFNAAPGAIFAETVKQGVRGGFRPAFAVQVGSLVGDLVWAVLGLAGAGLLLQANALRLPLGLAGAAYLTWLAWDAWCAAGRHLAQDAPDTQPCTRSAMRTGAVMSLTNPHNVAYWAAIGSAMGAIGVANPGMQDYAVFLLAFMTASVLWCVVCAALVDRVFRRAGTTWARLTYRLCAIALLALALGSVRDLVMPAQTSASSDAQHGSRM